MIKTVDRDKLFIIAVDGLDVSGKETFCKNLCKVLDNNIRHKYLMNATVTPVAFPRYETKYGIQIKEILRTPLDDRDVVKLENLFSEDRVDFFNTFIKEKYEENKMNIIVCDRYAYANLIFQHLNFINETDPVERACKSFEVRQRFMQEFNHIPKPDLTLIFNRMDEDSSKLHDTLITNKADKDLNESIEIQKYLSDIINTELCDVIVDTCDTLITVPIGSTFNSDTYSNSLEEAVSEEVMLKMKNLGMNRVIYPASRYIKNGLSSKILGGCKVVPSVKITMEPTEESVDVVNYIKNEYFVPMLDEYNANINRNIPLYDSLYRILNKIPHKEKLVNKELILDIFDKMFEFIKVEPSTGRIVGLDNEVQANDIIARCLFTPRKDSELSSPYTILAPTEYELEAGEIKEVSLLVDINSICGLNRDTQNRIIDIDIKTNRECVLNYGVVIADSPSSLSCDFTGELKVVLINHKNENVVIPIGSKLASMMIKRSSCVTEFDIK